MKLSTDEKALFEFIRSQYCISCGGIDQMDKYGEPRVTVSHVLPRGSQRRDEHFNNVVPMCVPCHRKFEDSTKTKRLKLIPLAIEYTKMFWEGREH